MKKLLYSIMALAGVVATSCTQEHIEAQFVPGNVVAPVLGVIEDVDFSEDGADIVVDYTAADFGVTTSSVQAIYLDRTGNDFANKVKLNATFDENKITIKAVDLLSAILSTGLKPGEEGAVEAVVIENLATDKGANIANTDTQSNIVTFNVSTSAVVAPVINEVSDVELKENGEDITISYSGADFGVAAEHSVVYALYIDLAGNELAKKVKVDATFDQGTITVKAENLNTAVLNTEAEPGAATDFDFVVSASVTEISGLNALSNVESANVKSYAANILPSIKYDVMYVVGTLNDWSHDNVKTNFDYIYNYNGDSDLYKGIIDLRKAEAAAEFKLTAGDWGNEEHSMSGAHDAEAATISLVAGGGDNINAYKAYQYYGVEFSKSGLTLKKLWSANKISIIGLNGDWNTDIDMKYNRKWARFYVDIEVAAATEMKFRADGDWALNWGVDCAVDGGNIPVDAGNYRVYFNPVSGVIELNPKAYNTTEDTGVSQEPAPEPTEDTWGLMGDFQDNTWSTDIALVAEGDYLVAQDVIFANANDEGLVFKVRKNANWSTSYGVAAEGATYDVGATIALDGGNNISINGEVGVKYDVYFNVDAMSIVVMADGATPAN